MESMIFDSSNLTTSAQMAKLGCKSAKLQAPCKGATEDCRTSIHQHGEQNKLYNHLKINQLEIKSSFNCFF
jgi:membrane protein insertase Oxa1/YidC/SpoIIIJ